MTAYDLAGLFVFLILSSLSVLFVLAMSHMPSPLDECTGDGCCSGRADPNP